MSSYKFEYHYGSESEQYSFYRIPKALFTDTLFKGISCEAKVLYGLMLDRMGLSRRNNWIDEENRVYIYFTLDEVTEAMGCKQEKGVKLLAELDDIKGIGLIERKKRGMGKPTMIFVKNFILSNDITAPENQNIGLAVNRSQDLGKSEVKTSENQKSGLRKNGSQDFGKSEVKTSENQKSGLRKNGSQDFGKSETSNNNINNNNINDNKYSDTENQSINPSIHLSIKPEQSGKRQSPTTVSDKAVEAYNTYREIIKDNIDYASLSPEYIRKETVDEIVEIMLETICSNKKIIRVRGENIPAEIVKSRLLKLDFTHIDYVIDCMKQNTTKINNIRSYLLTALYNAPNTINHYYQSEVNHDFYGG